MPISLPASFSLSKHRRKHSIQAGIRKSPRTESPRPARTNERTRRSVHACGCVCTPLRPQKVMPESCTPPMLESSKRVVEDVQLSNGTAVHACRSGLDHSKLVTSTLFISNLHCPSCASSIEEVLHALCPRPASFAFSFVFHSLQISHCLGLEVRKIVTALEEIGFEVHSVFQDGDETTGSQPRELNFYGKGKKEISNDWEKSLEAAVKSGSIYGNIVVVNKKNLRSYLRRSMQYAVKTAK